MPLLLSDYMHNSCCLFTFSAPLQLFTARSPLFTHVAATMQGITTIRALNCQELLVQQYDGHQVSRIIIQQCAELNWQCFFGSFCG